MRDEQTQWLNAISPAEVDRLLRIAGAAQGFLRHDLAGAGGSVFFLLQKMQDFFDGKITAKDLRQRRNLFVGIQSKFSNLMNVIRNHLIIKEVRWGLASYLPEVVETIASDLEERGIKLLATQGPPAYVMFPENALYSIMLELARNAAVHAPGSQIALEWSIESDKLIVSIHDGGKAIDHLLTDRLLALEMMENELTKKTESGLSIIRRIVHCSGGLLLVRRSRILGGAEFSVRLPISSHFEEIDK